MGNCCSQRPQVEETNGTSPPGHWLDDFKNEPAIIPAKEVTRLETFPSGTGGLVETNGTSLPDHQLVNFKIEPAIIPAQEVTKIEMFANGTGGLGDVWKCTWSQQSGTCLKVAVKSIRIPHSDDKELIAKTGQRIRREAYVWIDLKHDNILELHGITEGFGLLPALVSPWIEKGSLDSYLKQHCDAVLGNAETLQMLRQIAAGLKYLHDKGVVHGDLTITNVLVSDDGKIYLADFGLSMILAESQNSTFSSCHPGNMRWMAPEMLALPEEGEVIKPTKAADIYSYGCIMLQLLSGLQPYSWLKQAMHVMRARVDGTGPFLDLQIAGVEKHHRDYSLSCLSEDFVDRPDVSGIVAFLAA